jgi:hypothetical protein
MSPITGERPRIVAQAPRPAAPRPARSRLGGLREPALVWAVAFSVYAAVGLYMTLELHLVLVDAESRLENAFTVWWNVPQKLAAIGFYWPPLQTIALLPLTAVHPLATSLAALPLTSAALGAAVAVVIERTLARAGLERPLRWALTAAFALNPMILFYSANGMAEVLTVLFLAWAFALLVRWALAPRWWGLPSVGAAFALGVLSRYEIGLWLPIVAAAAVWVLARQRQSAARIESSTIALLAPPIYAVALWTFINWTLTGSALGYVTNLVPQQASTGAALARPLTASALSLVWQVVEVHLLLFPPTLALGAGLLYLAHRRRDPVAAALGLSAFVNVASSIAFVLHARAGYLLELRYNMRAMPIAMVSIGWLIASAPAHRRRLLGIGALVAVVASAPVTGWVMAHHEWVVGERAFIRALLSGDAQDGIPVPEGSGVSVAQQRRVSAYIRAHIHGRNAVFTDDAQTYGIQVLDGDPTRYLDRVDVGDRAWLAVRDDPVGKVRYVLVNRNRFRLDLVADRYPGIRTGRPPAFLRPVLADGDYVLYRVESPE